MFVAFHCKYILSYILLIFTIMKSIFVLRFWPGLSMFHFIYAIKSFVLEIILLEYPPLN